MSQTWLIFKSDQKVILKETVCDKNSEGLDLCTPQDSNPQEWQKQLE